jgi:hypothetical protein
MNSIKVGSVVTHPYRKTIKFVVTDIKHNCVIIHRADQIRGEYVVSPKYKNYRVPNNEIQSLKIVGESVVAPAKSTPAKSTPAKKTIADLQKDIFVSPNIVKEFLWLENLMSPENLHCDGEISPAQARAKLVQLKAKWALLEQYVGYSVEM